MTGSGGVIVVKGWAFDPNVTGPSNVQFYVDGSLAGTLAAGERRRRRCRLFRGGLEPRLHRVPHPLRWAAPRVRLRDERRRRWKPRHRLRDRRRRSATARCHSPRAHPRAAMPLGNVDGLNVGSGRARIFGWALDPDTTAPIDVHVYVDGALAAITSAGLDRPDVGAAFPGMGSARLRHLRPGRPGPPHRVRLRHRRHPHPHEPPSCRAVAPPGSRSSGRSGGRGPELPGAERGAAGVLEPGEHGRVAHAAHHLTDAALVDDVAGPAAGEVLRGSRPRSTAPARSWRR